ncbi:MAG: iron-sulfur cluster assembly scaffold protein [Acidobacteriota bacterium]
MSIYRYPINDLFQTPKHAGQPDVANGVGTSATFVCGSFVRLSIRVDPETKIIIDARYQTNGCGYMVAAAEVIAGHIERRRLAELHSLDQAWMDSVIESNLGVFEGERQHCKDACFAALHDAFAGYRAWLIEEFHGEKGLICTCFGVTEETIEAAIDQKKARSVEQVASMCRAGSGCGSCRMMIQEMIDETMRGSDMI